MILLILLLSVYEGMLGRSLVSPASPLNYAFCISNSHHTVSATILSASKLSHDTPPNPTRLSWTPNLNSRKWLLQFSAKTDNIVLTEEEAKTLETCRKALSPFKFSAEEEDKILGKAFGLIHSPYWSEERKKEVPKFEIVNEILEYLRSLSLSDDDLSKVLKKFPEVLGCSLEDELMTNVKILEKNWFIKGKTLRNLLLRNPKVLGFNVDCKGDCMAQCTRCWVRL